MHHRQRRRVQEADREVAIRRCVHAVGDDAREARGPGQSGGVDRIAGAGDRARAERQRIGLVHRHGQPLVIAPQRRGVAEQEVADQHRHRTTHVGVGRHQRVAGAVGLIGQRRDHGAHPGLQQRNAPPQVETEVERHLLVARTAGVQAPSVVADKRHQLPFDEAVDVLVVAADPGGIGAAALENLLQAVADAADGRGVEGAGASPARRPTPGCR